MNRCVPFSCPGRPRSLLLYLYLQMRHSVPGPEFTPVAGTAELNHRGADTSLPR